MPIGAAVRRSGSAVPPLRSAVYEGTLHHRRSGPGPAHQFSYRVAMPLLDLAEIDDVTRLHPFWSSRWPAPVWFRRADFMGHPGTSLDETVRELVERRTGRRPKGSVSLLANVRTWGWLFNPISLYFCHDAEDANVEALVADVKNTPWHESCSYVVGPPGSHRFAKTMHVSPFLPMGVDYELAYSQPGERLSVRLDVLRGDERLLSAVLSLRRQILDRQALARLLWAYPAMAHRVSAGIYAQAARLRLKGAPFYAHPARSAPAGQTGPGARQ